MSTIGSLIIEIAGDNSKLRQSLNDSSKLTATYSQELKRAQTEFAASALRIREDLFRGALSPAEYARQGKIAAAEYNTAVLRGIDDIRASGRLTPKLHARLVTELRDVGLEAGEALGTSIAKGAESTSVVTAGIARRIQSTLVGVSFALEAMANGSESMSRRALRSVTLLAFAFGPQAGGITLAITTATQFLMDYFHKAREEAEKTMQQFRQHLAEMARAGPGGFQQAFALQQQLFSGDPFAGIEGQRKEETAQQFEARRLGIEGVNRELAKQKALVADALKHPDVGAALAGGSKELRDARVRVHELTEELATLEAQQKQLAPVLASTLAAESHAAQNALDVAAIKAATSAAKKDTPAARAEALEATLSQVTQTKAALKAAGEPTGLLNTELVQIIHDATTAEVEHNAVLVKQGKLYDNISVRLTEIRAKAEESLFGGLKLPGTGTDIIGQPAVKPATPQLAALRAGFGVNTILANANLSGQIAPAQLPKSAPLSKFEIQIIKLNDSLERGATAVGKFGLSLVKGLGEALNPLRLIGQVFQQFASAFVPVLDPLAAVFAKLASVVAQDLAPLFKALEPVLAALIPVIDAILRVVTPILTALVPVLDAFVPILKALFPILKAGAIIATYLFQAFALGASIFLRAIGNIVIGWGAILKALATAIDKLPFVNARGAINAAQGVIDFGNSLLNASDEFKKSADEMGKAREEIKKVDFDDTTSDVKKLGEAASETADALRGVPAWWKSQLAIWEATHPRDGATPPPGTGGAGGGRPGTQSLTGPALVPPSITPAPIIVPPIGTGGSGGGLTGTPADTTPRLSLRVDNITIAEPVKTGRELLDEVVAEAKKYAQATFGTTSRWYEVL